MRIPVADRLGAEGDGFRLAMSVFDRNRPVVAGAAIGVARRALREATAYASVREAFGKPIADHQAVGHKLADMAMQIDAARLLALSAAEQIDEGRRTTRLAAQSKAFATDVALQAAADAAQIFGAARIMGDAAVSKLLRDAKVLQIYEGTNEIQRNIIVHELLREEAATLATTSTDPVDMTSAAVPVTRTAANAGQGLTSP